MQDIYKIKPNGLCMYLTVAVLPTKYIQKCGIKGMHVFSGPRRNADFWKHWCSIYVCIYFEKITNLNNYNKHSYFSWSVTWHFEEVSFDQ